MPAATSELIILGAGIAGCALAYHLAHRGATSVTVVDPRTPAAGASGRAAGVVTEQLWNEWDVSVVRESHREYAELCRRFAPGAYRRNGFLRWSHESAVAPRLEAAHARLRAWGAEVRLLDGDELAERVPEARFGSGAVGLDSPGDACVDPTALTGIYAEGARKEGVRFELGATVRAVAREGSRWVVRAGPDELRAARLVLAAGAWTKRIAQELGRPLPLAPYRTQAALLRPRRPVREGMPTGHDLDRDVYVRPELNGRILAGDGTEEVEVDPERVPSGAEGRFLEALAGALEERWPSCSDSEVAAAWSGVCTATPDRRPLIGPVPGAEGLFVMTGFNGFGIMRGGGAARRLALLLTEGEGSPLGSELLAPVDPARFGEPARPFSPRPGFTLEEGDDPRL